MSQITAAGRRDANERRVIASGVVATD